MLTASTWERIDEVALRAHAATDEVSLRTGFLTNSQALVPHQISFFDLVGNDHRRRVFFDPVSTTMARDDLLSYYDRFIEVDYTTWVQNQPSSRPVFRDTDFISLEALRQSTLYREWLEPMDVMYGCCLVVSHEGVDYGTVTFGRSEREGDFTDDELEVLRVLARHLGLRMAQLFPNGIPYEQDKSRRALLSSSYGLTRRELEVARLLCRGVTTRHISEALCIAPATVSRHTANIYAKVGVNSRIELMNALGERL